MTVNKQQKTLLFRPECLPSICYIEQIRVLNLTIASYSPISERVGNQR